MKARIINYVLYALGIFIAGTGFILEWKMPHGSAGREASLWAMAKGTWKDIHLWTGIAFTALTLWHLYDHRKWLMNVACKKSSGKMLAGLLIPLAVVVAIAASPIGKLPSGHGGCQSGGCGSCSSKDSCSDSKSSCSSGACSSGSCKDKKGNGKCSDKKEGGACSSGKCGSEHKTGDTEAKELQETIDTCPITGKSSPQS
ncbi:DUF4405 domain-containing protein [Verrucomicrobiaceae bacterium N1E253]|uniref:DUF4405 domain-containing protein n=1 Tax=Oceaniferula marina TaxID=2748318 RepID=A0A851GN83_9BACT|nr:DUF4405 domain-containing protein [Oceaniferula marina]NWK56487.1 DUF4405 domain-containing protein [Oceaniferula marina]